MADAVLDGSKKGLEVSRPYLAQGGGETIDSLKNRYAGLIQPGNFGGGGEGPLANKLASLRAERLGDMNTELDLNMPLKYADRQREFQGVSNANQAVLRAEQLERDQRAAAKKAKKGSFMSGALGLIGTAVGAYFGGPAGASVGGGIGTSVGSQLG